VIAIFALGVLISGLCLLFLDQVVTLLGANQELHGLVRSYMQIILYFAPVLIVALTLDYFVRADGRPLLASAALVSFAVLNIGLNWLFIVQWGWGIEGAAWATALAESFIFFILLVHWFSPRCSLKLIAVREGWDELLSAAWNGFSEFANELSIGLVTLLFNWVMITRLGVEGVAAFTIIGYLLMIGIEVSYGIAESMQPTVSKNLGARQPKRIKQFIMTGLIASSAVGLLVSALFLLAPNLLVTAFLSEGEQATEAIALAFIAVFWPAFLFNGMNITLSSCFTALHKPIPSAVIAVMRSLVLPVAGLMLLPRWFGDTGVFMAIPLSEALTFVVAMALMLRYRSAEIN
jgi:Na+-driven multidrug efflux pump